MQTTNSLFVVCSRYSYTQDWLLVGVYYSMFFCIDNDGEACVIVINVVMCSEMFPGREHDSQKQQKPARRAEAPA